MHPKYDICNITIVIFFSPIAKAINGAIKKSSIEVIPKIKQRRLRVITLQDAIAKAQYGKIDNLIVHQK